MHFLADQAIKSCHQSRSLSVPAVSRGGRIRERRGWRAQLGRREHCRGFVRARRPHSSPGFAGCRRLGESALSLLVSRSQACGSVGPASGVEGVRLYTTPSRGRGPARPPTPSRSLRAAGTCDRLSALPCIRQGLLLFSKCISCPPPRRPAPPRPCWWAQVCGPCAGGGRGPRAQLLPLTGRRQVASALCCEGDAGLGPGSWSSVDAGALGGGC